MIKAFMSGRVAKDARIFNWKNSNNENKTGISFGLICNRWYGDENPTYMQCTLYRGNNKLADMLSTGRQVFVQGTISRNKDGYYNVDVDDFDLGMVPNGKSQGYTIEREGPVPGHSEENGENPVGQENGFGEDYNPNGTLPF